MELTEERLAEECGISRRTLATYRIRGCRATTANEVRAWRNDHVLPRRGGPKRIDPPLHQAPSIEQFLERSKPLLDLLDYWQVITEQPDLGCELEQGCDLAAVGRLRSASIQLLLIALEERRNPNQGD